MYYIFNEQGQCVCCCNYEPDADDIGSRNETAIFGETVYENISRLQLIDGVITEMPLPEPSQEELYIQEANNVKTELRAMAVNAMMMNLAGNDITETKNEYQAKIASVSDSVALYCVDVFPVWSGNSVQYDKDDRVSYNGVLYKVLQTHTSQATWTPTDAPSLFAKVLTSDTGEILDWEQPDSTNAYMKGDKVRYNGKVYESLIDNNVWSPEGYPAGWREIIENEE